MTTNRLNLSQYTVIDNTIYYHYIWQCVILKTTIIVLIITQIIQLQYLVDNLRVGGRFCTCLTFFLRRHKGYKLWLSPYTCILNYMIVIWQKKQTYKTIDFKVNWSKLSVLQNQGHGFDPRLTCLTLFTHEISLCPVVGRQTVWMKESVTLSLTAHQWIPKRFTDLKYKKTELLIDGPQCHTIMM